MNKRYKISFTYTQDIDKTFRYHSTATVLMQFLKDGLFTFHLTAIDDDPNLYYTIIMNHINLFINTKKLTPVMEDDSFTVIIEELGGLHTMNDNFIAPSPITTEDNTVVYNGLLSDMVNHFNPDV